MTGQILQVDANDGELAIPVGVSSERGLHVRSVKHIVLK
jgi:hypothetical protein